VKPATRSPLSPFAKTAGAGQVGRDSAIIIHRAIGGFHLSQARIGCRDTGS
jgi:hypothetical protein